MFSYDKPLKKSVTCSTRKNPSINPAQSAGIVGTKQTGPYQVQSVPCVNQKTMAISNVSSRIQKLSTSSNTVGPKAAPSQDPGDIQRIAAGGVQGTGQRLPHIDRIQKAFGHHDISSVKAYWGAQAVNASRMIGARAYATGNKVAFANSRPDLHTTAHEAAHIIQQRAGVHLKKGVGETGDRYEQQADKVADCVVQGRSAESLLDSQTVLSNKVDLNAQSLQSRTAVQRAVGYEFETGWLVEVEESVTSRFLDREFYHSKLKSLTGQAEPSNKFKKRRPLKKKERIKTADGYKIEADEAGKQSEIEFIVDPPIPENSKGLTALEKVMKKMIYYGRVLEANAKEAAAKNENGKEERMEQEPKETEFSIQGDNNKKFYITTDDLELKAKPQITTGLDLALINQLHTINRNLRSKKQLPKEFNEMLSLLQEPKNVPEDASSELKGLLTIIVTYLERGATPDASDTQQFWLWQNAIDYPKIIANIILARTQFSKLFKLLPEVEQKYYRKNPTQWVKLVMEVAGGLDPEKPVIERGIRRDETGDTTEAVDVPPLTRRDWLVGITEGKDKLRKIKDAESMGALKDKTEKVGSGMNKKVGIFELRHLQINKLPLGTWNNFATQFFKFIMAAHAGEGKTSRGRKRLKME